MVADGITVQLARFFQKTLDAAIRKIAHRRDRPRQLKIPPSSPRAMLFLPPRPSARRLHDNRREEPAAISPSFTRKSIALTCIFFKDFFNFSLNFTYSRSVERELRYETYCTYAKKTALVEYVYDKIERK